MKGGNFRERYSSKINAEKREELVEKLGRVRSIAMSGKSKKRFNAWSLHQVSGLQMI